MHLVDAILLILNSDLSYIHTYVRTYTHTQIQKETETHTLRD